MKLKHLNDIQDFEVLEEIQKRRDLINSNTVNLATCWILLNEIEVLNTRKLNSYYESSNNHSS